MTETQAYIIARCDVQDDGCWRWNRSIGSHGYGNASFRPKRVTTAHRVAYEAFKGPIPAGLLVQHSCDNRRCVNPDHLSLGTDATNAIDKQIKGRAAKRFSFADVIRIRKRLSEGVAIRALAREFNVSQRAVQLIDRHETWRHAYDAAQGVAAPDDLERIPSHSQKHKAA